jgi:TIR domain
MSTSPDTFRYDAFISYSHKDSAWVRNVLLPRLEREGLRICIDYRDFELGVPSIVNMEKAIQDSRKTLLVLTPDWVASDWTAFEALLIQTSDPIGRGKRILPLLATQTPLPARLAIFTYLDLTDPAQLEFQIERLVAAIRGALPLAPAQESDHTQSAETRPATYGFSYERGLDALKGLLAQADIETCLAFATLDQRLRENLRDEGLYGSNETIRSERARIVKELNRLALTQVRRTFNELCGA